MQCGLRGSSNLAIHCLLFLQVLLLDSLQKRCKFVEQVVRHLQIDNADVLWSRAEAAGRDPNLREVQHS